ncbi:alpha/beta hydrolase, partial [Burkholderia pseudomallei]
MDAFDFRRQISSTSAECARVRPALAVSDVVIGGYAQDIALRRYRRPDISSLPVVLYFHGGGFVRGSLDDAE